MELSEPANVTGWYIILSRTYDRAAVCAQNDRLEALAAAKATLDHMLHDAVVLCVWYTTYLDTCPYADPTLSRAKGRYLPGSHATLAQPVHGGSLQACTVT